MLENSQEILTMAKSVALIGFTAFVCWGLFYFAMILRQGFLIVKEMRDRIHTIDEIIKTLKDKIEHSTSYLLLISEGVKKLVEVVKDKSDKWDNKEEKKK